MSFATLVRQVVVDDTDDRILYTGPGWFLDSTGSQDAIGYRGSAYRHTLHGTKVNGSFSFSFQGIQVTVLGTYDLLSPENVTLDWSCFVDNIDAAFTQHFTYPPGNNVRLCGTNGLNDGHHELIVNVTAADQTFWLDSIQYSPSLNLPLEPDAVLRIDNTDPEIVYSGSFLKWRNQPDINSMHRTAILSSANFSFIGTGFSWIGSILTDLAHIPSQATYSIDWGPQVPFRLNIPPPGTDIPLYGQEFFSMDNLPVGPHTLQVMYQGNDSQTPLTLDYLYVITNSSTTITTSNTKPSISTSTSTSINTNTSSSSGGPSPNTHSWPIGAIAGSVVGGTAFIVLTLLLFFWFRQRRSQTQRNDTRPEVMLYSYNTVDTASHPAMVRYNPVPGSTLQKREIVIQPILSRPPFDERNSPMPPSFSPSLPSLQEDPPPSYTTSIR